MGKLKCAWRLTSNIKENKLAVQEKRRSWRIVIVLKVGELKISILANRKNLKGALPKSLILQLSLDALHHYVDGRAAKRGAGDEVASGPQGLRDLITPNALRSRGPHKIIQQQ